MPEIMEAQASKGVSRTTAISFTVAVSRKFASASNRRWADRLAENLIA